MLAKLSTILSPTLRERGHKMPPRLLEAMRIQQDSSEVLIGWIQLGVVIVFAVLYTLAPKTFSEEVEFAPVPWALSAYFLFTVIRLVLAHHRKLPDWLLYVSVVVDIALLFGLIWTFHIQYDQPPSFYLKAPTLLYVFIFISLRALRFEARFVATAGAVAAVGWLMMMFYVMTHDPQGEMITRDYVQYMTSNSMLLGAEFDKVISILMVTTILAIALHRARGLLVQSVVESTVARDLSRFVPTEVAQQLKSSDHEMIAGEGEVRQTTVLFADVEKFTTLCENMSPTELITTLNEFCTAVAEPIERFGGVINQFQGDAILASFNLPKANEDHAANAVRAAIAIQKVLGSRTFGDGISFRSRIGVNTGVIVGGLVGTSDRLSYTVLGDDVNLAARLEQLNKQYSTQILVSESTYRLAGPDRFSFNRIGEVKVRGRQADTTIYMVDPDASSSD